MDAFAFVCCKVAFQNSRVCKLHVCICSVVGSLVCACVLVFSRVIVYAFAFVCCKVAFHIAAVEIACLVCLYACFACDCVCASL